MILELQRALKDDGVIVSLVKLCNWFGVPRRTVYYKPTKGDPKGNPLGQFSVGVNSVEALLQRTIDVALTIKLIFKASLSTVIVDSTIQHKAIAYPTDAKMLETARTKLVAAAKDQGIELKQAFAKEGNHLCRKAGRYAHAKQYKRMRKTLKRQRTIVGRLRREIDRKLSPLGQDARDVMASTLAKAGRVFDQIKGKKIKGGQPKLYSWHTPEAHCFSKGKARTPFEFGAKVGIAVTAKGNLIVGARAFTGAPFDGHTLHEQTEQTTILLQDIGIKPTTAVVDLGYRGVDADNLGLTITHRGKAKRLDAEGLKLIKQRNAIEPVIGHTSRLITGWIVAISRARSAKGCMLCCARRATTSVGCCGTSPARA
jgi:IS5 family transposase